jgi:hypothetical protein
MVSIGSISSSNNPKIGTGGTAWGTTQALEAKKKQRVPIFVGAGVAALVVLTVGIGLAMKSGSTPKNDTQAAPTSANTNLATQAATTVTATVTAPPTVWEPLTTAAAATTSTATQTIGATRPGQTAKPPASAKATSTTTTTTKTSPTVTAPPKTFE